MNFLELQIVPGQVHIKRRSISRSDNQVFVYVLLSDGYEVLSIPGKGVFNNYQKAGDYFKQLATQNKIPCLHMIAIECYINGMQTSENRDKLIKSLLISVQSLGKYFKVHSQEHKANHLNRYAIEQVDLNIDSILDRQWYETFYIEWRKNALAQMPVESALLKYDVKSKNKKLSSSLVSGEVYLNENTTFPYKANSYQEAAGLLIDEVKRNTQYKSDFFKEAIHLYQKSIENGEDIEKAIKSSLPCYGYLAKYFSDIGEELQGRIIRKKARDFIAMYKHHIVDDNFIQRNVLELEYQYNLMDMTKIDQLKSARRFIEAYIALIAKVEELSKDGTKKITFNKIHKNEMRLLREIIYVLYPQIESQIIFKLESLSEIYLETVRLKLSNDDAWLSEVLDQIRVAIESVYDYKTVLNLYSTHKKEVFHYIRIYNLAINESISLEEKIGMVWQLLDITKSNSTNDAYIMCLIKHIETIKTSPMLISKVKNDLLETNKEHLINAVVSQYENIESFSINLVTLEQINLLPSSVLIDLREIAFSNIATLKKESNDFYAVRESFTDIKKRPIFHLNLSRALLFNDHMTYIEGAFDYLSSQNYNALGIKYLDRLDFNQDSIAFQIEVLRFLWQLGATERYNNWIRKIVDAHNHSEYILLAIIENIKDFEGNILLYILQFLDQQWLQNHPQIIFAMFQKYRRYVEALPVYRYDMIYMTSKALKNFVDLISTLKESVEFDTIISFFDDLGIYQNCEDNHEIKAYAIKILGNTKERGLVLVENHLKYLYKHGNIGLFIYFVSINFKDITQNIELSKLVVRKLKGTKNREHFKRFIIEHFEYWPSDFEMIFDEIDSETTSEGNYINHDDKDYHKTILKMIGQGEFYGALALYHGGSQEFVDYQIVKTISRLRFYIESGSAERMTIAEIHEYILKEYKKAAMLYKVDAETYELDPLRSKQDYKISIQRAIACFSSISAFTDLNIELNKYSWRIGKDEWYYEQRRELVLSSDDDVEDKIKALNHLITEELRRDNVELYKLYWVYGSIFKKINLNQESARFFDLAYRNLRAMISSEELEEQYSEVLEDLYKELFEVGLSCRDYLYVFELSKQLRAHQLKLLENVRSQLGEHMLGCFESVFIHPHSGPLEVIELIADYRVKLIPHESYHESNHENNYFREVVHFYFDSLSSKFLDILSLMLQVIYVGKNEYWLSLLSQLTDDFDAIKINHADEIIFKRINLELSVYFFVNHLKSDSSMTIDEKYQHVMRFVKQWKWIVNYPKVENNQTENEAIKQYKLYSTQMVESSQIETLIYLLAILFDLKLDEKELTNLNDHLKKQLSKLRFFRHNNWTKTMLLEMAVSLDFKKKLSNKCSLRDNEISEYNQLLTIVIGNASCYIDVLSNKIPDAYIEINKSLKAEGLFCDAKNADSSIEHMMRLKEIRLGFCFHLIYFGFIELGKEMLEGIDNDHIEKMSLSKGRGQYTILQTIYSWIDMMREDQNDEVIALPLSLLEVASELPFIVTDMMYFDTLYLELTQMANLTNKKYIGEILNDIYYSISFKNLASFERGNQEIHLDPVYLPQYYNKQSILLYKHKIFNEWDLYIKQFRSMCLNIKTYLRDYVKKDDKFPIKAMGTTAVSAIKKIVVDCILDVNIITSNQYKEVIYSIDFELRSLEKEYNAKKILSNLPRLVKNVKRVLNYVRENEDVISNAARNHRDIFELQNNLNQVEVNWTALLCSKDSDIKHIRTLIHTLDSDMYRNRVYKYLFVSDEDDTSIIEDPYWSAIEKMAIRNTKKYKILPNSVISNIDDAKNFLDNVLHSKSIDILMEVIDGLTFLYGDSIVMHLKKATYSDDEFGRLNHQLILDYLVDKQMRMSLGLEYLLRTKQYDKAIALSEFGKLITSSTHISTKINWYYAHILYYREIPDVIGKLNDKEKAFKVENGAVINLMKNENMAQVEKDYLSVLREVSDKQRMDLYNINKTRIYLKEINTEIYKKFIEDIRSSLDSSYIYFDQLVAFLREKESENTLTELREKELIIPYKDRLTHYNVYQKTRTSMSLWEAPQRFYSSLELKIDEKIELLANQYVDKYRIDFTNPWRTDRYDYKRLLSLMNLGLLVTRDLCLSKAIDYNTHAQILLSVEGLVALYTCAPKVFHDEGVDIRLEDVVIYCLKLCNYKWAHTYGVFLKNILTILKSLQEQSLFKFVHVPQALIEGLTKVANLFYETERLEIFNALDRLRGEDWFVSKKDLLEILDVWSVAAKERERRPEFFVSYFSNDEYIIAPIVKELLARGYRVFYAPKSINVLGNEEWREAIIDAIKNSDLFLLFLPNKRAVERIGVLSTENGKSYYKDNENEVVVKEYQTFLNNKKMIDKKCSLIPICYEDIDISMFPESIDNQRFQLKKHDFESNTRISLISAIIRSLEKVEEENMQNKIL